MVKLHPFYRGTGHHYPGKTVITRTTHLTHLFGLQRLTGTSSKDFRLITIRCEANNILPSREKTAEFLFFLHGGVRTVGEKAAISFSAVLHSGHRRTRLPRFFHPGSRARRENDHRPLACLVFLQFVDLDSQQEGVDQGDYRLHSRRTCVERLYLRFPSRKERVA